MNVERKLDELGRIVIPIEIRRAWGVTAGNTLLLTSTPDGALRITPAQRRCSLCHQPGAEGLTEVGELCFCPACLRRLQALSL